MDNQSDSKIDEGLDPNPLADNLASEGVFDPNTHADGFDPAVHAVDASGQPIPSASGSGYRKKRGRKAGTILKNTTPAATKTPLEKQAQKISSDELARVLLNLSVGGAVAIIGNEWDFTSKDEADGMRAAVSGYIEAKGDGSLSPEGMLAVVIAAYALGRIKHENTRSKIGKMFDYIFSFFKK